MPATASTIALVAATAQSYLLFALSSQPWTLLGALACNLTLNLTFLWLYNYLIWPNVFSPLRHLPGPSGALPLIGHALAQFETPVGSTYTRWMSTIKNDGLLRYQTLWHQEAVLLTSPTAIAEVFVAKCYSFRKPALFSQLLSTLLGNGLLVVEADVHKFQRKKLLPLFSYRNIRNLCPSMWSKSQELCDRIDHEFKHESSTTIDIAQWSQMAAVDVIGVTAFGRDLNCIWNQEDNLATLYGKIMSLNPTRVAYWGACILFGPRFVRSLRLPFGARVEAELSKLHGICKSVVEEKRKALAEKPEGHTDLLAVLMRSGDFDDVELVDQLLTTLGAGSETTAFTFTFACWELVNQPHIQLKLRKELEDHREELSAAGDCEDDTLVNLLESLPYLNAVLQETLRFYPTGPTTSRQAAEDVVITGHRVPKGTEVVMPNISINRSVELWGDDADRFVPERWIEKATGKIDAKGGAVSNYANTTFLAGPRSCIGASYSKMELRCLIASVTARFNMANANKTPPRLFQVGSLRPLDGMKITFSPIKSG